MINNILVIGGTGKTGRKVVQRLQAQGLNVRVGSRNVQPAFDWHTPAGWHSALQGMDAIYVTYQPDLAVPGAYEAVQELLQQASANNIKKVVLLSGRGEHEAQRCEQLLIQSGLNYSIVRCSWFSQNFSESFFLPPVLAGHVALPNPEAKIPFLDTDDIADMAVATLLDSKHNGQLYELTGPRQLTFKEAVAEISKATGRQLSYSPISLQAYIEGLRQAQVPDEYVWLINLLFTEVLGNEDNNRISHDIQHVLGRPAKDFSVYAQETAATGIWNAAVGQEA